MIWKTLTLLSLVFAQILTSLYLGMFVMHVKANSVVNSVLLRAAWRRSSSWVDFVAFPPVCGVVACSHCGRVAHQAPAETTHALGNQLGKDQTVWRLTCTAAFTKMEWKKKQQARNVVSL